MHYYRKSAFALVLFVLMADGVYPQKEKKVLLNARNEKWWVGIIQHGYLMPIKATYHADTRANCYGNQAQPLLLSDQGRLIWCENPFSITCKKGCKTIRLNVPSKSIHMVLAGATLRDAYLYASSHYFPPSGRQPDEALFRFPQYNTWIELQYNQNENDILHYAKGILHNGFPAGVLIIDDNWQEDYGIWEFHPTRFKQPKAMIDSLHAMGFRVMLWICPFVSPDSETGRELAEKDFLIKDQLGNPKIIRWWNGASYLLDFTNPGALEWFKHQLNWIKTNYSVDGFKFDAGDPEFYYDAVSFSKATPNEHCELYASLGLDYPFNEFRATWKMGGQPLGQRLRDKRHSWDDLQQLIPNSLLQGIMGYPFSCPDLIGGGEIESFLQIDSIDQNLIVRSAQCHAFMPMMQFSAAPWKILDSIHLQAVKKAVALRMTYISEILELVKESTVTGEPVIRMMEYEFPHMGYSCIKDQFMLGRRIIVAPVTNPTGKKEIYLPPGLWRDMMHGNDSIAGPCILHRNVPIDEIPFFVKIY